jgi:hypothetical protein
MRGVLEEEDLARSADSRENHQWMLSQSSESSAQNGGEKTQNGRKSSQFAILIFLGFFSSAVMEASFA